MPLMLPLGIVYFTISVTLLGVSVGFIGAPFVKFFSLVFDVLDSWRRLKGEREVPGAAA